MTVVEGPSAALDIAPLTDSMGTFVIDGLQEGDWVLQALGPKGEIGQALVHLGIQSPTVEIIIEKRPNTM